MAQGTSGELRDSLGDVTHIAFRVRTDARLDLLGMEADISAHLDGVLVRIASKSVQADLGRVLHWADGQALELADLEVVRPTLDDVFVELAEAPPEEVPRAVSDVSLAVAQTRYSVKGYLRDPSALVFTIIMPVVLLLLFNAIFHGNTLFDGIHVKSAAYYTASIIAYTIMLNGFGSLVIRIATDREAGQLKRYRGTPMPSWVYLFAEIGRSVVTIVVTSGVLLAVGALFYGVTVSGHMVVGLVVYVVVGTACFAALGLALRACLPDH